MNKTLPTYEEFMGKFEVYPTQYKARAKKHEAHHIIPKAVQKRIAGTVYDDRCVRLTYFEHILAHYLYCKEHPEDKDEFIALDRMLTQRAKELLADEKKFLEELPDLAEMRKKGKRTEEWTKKIVEANRGKQRTEEQKKRISESHKGQVAWNKGIKMSDEFRRKISEANKGRVASEETRKKRSESMMGKNKGENHPMYGKHPSEETRKKRSESMKGKLAGEKHPLARKVYQYDLEGNIIQVFSTVTGTCNSLNISTRTIYRYLHGQTPKNLTYTLSYN